ncbi:MAG: MiaB-like tRNA modifying enzyme [Geobacteraceae bacterium]|nr:MiaB-like tRNA modifying enzyme [Geobacteraceae bacterium]
MKKAAITTLGCKTNQFESAAMVESLAKMDYTIVPFTDCADIYVINTCTVTAKSDAESRRLIRRARRQNPSAKIVVTGCYAQLAHGEIRELPGVSIILGNNEKKDLVGILEELEQEQIVRVSDIAKERRADAIVLETFSEHTRAFLQVQNGCDSYCSYCIVPHVRGSSRSVMPDEAVDGVMAFAGKGFKEVVLTGIHLGMYGIDLDPRTSLLDLLSAIEECSVIARLRIGSLEPAEIPDSLITFLAASKIVCPHLHIPLQSGDDRILGSMNRHYTTRFYRETIEKIMVAIPDVCIGTDIIAGFPGETDKEFNNTMKFLESLPLAYFHVFPFSPRAQTPAAGMSGQVHGSVVKERAKILRELSNAKKMSYYNRFLGRELPVLVQGREPDGSFKGLSRNYIPVRMIGDGNPLNTEVKATIREVDKEFVRGEMIS